jgi:LytS/YehU family sensor histidine kinase
MMILTIALAVAIRLSDRWKMLEEHRRELHHEQKARELENLKSQLNPHFLFNTLNTIYALIDVNTDDARSAIHRLSALLRYMLYENPAEVPLARELEFIDNYIALMRLRLGDGLLDVRIDDGGHSDALVAPLLLVSLIENAVKYGNTGRPSDKIEIDIRVARGRLRCHTFNHFLPQESSDRGAGGIGITNLRRRLHLLYGFRASLSTVVTADTYTTDLSIPLNAEIK